MFIKLKIILFLSCALLMSCAEDENTEKAKLSLNTGDITLNIKGGTLAYQTVKVSFSGDAVLVGSPVGSDGIPSWLTLKTVESTQNSAIYELVIEAPREEGEYSTYVRFVTGYNSSGDVELKDILITLTVTPPLELNFQAKYGQAILPESQNILFDQGVLEPNCSISFYGQASLPDNWLGVKETNNGYDFYLTEIHPEPGKYTVDVTCDKGEYFKTLIIVNYWIEEPKIEFSEVPTMEITNETLISSLKEVARITEGSDPLEWIVYGHGSMINAVKGDGGELNINIDEDDIANFSNGVHLQTVYIAYRLSDRVDYQIIELSVNLDINLTNEAAIQFADVADVVIDNGTVEGDLLLPVSLIGDGYYSGWNVSDYSEMLSVEKVSSEEGLLISIDKNKLNAVDNGVYEQWVDVLYTVPLSSKPRSLQILFELEKSISHIHYLTPKVIFSGNQQTMRVWGEKIDKITDEQILAINDNFSEVTRVNENEFEVIVSSSAANGEYKIYTPNTLDLETSKANLVIKPSPDFDPYELILPFRPENIIYDSVHESFYYTSLDNREAVIRVYSEDSSWQWNSYEISSAGGIALSIDGNKLMVGGENCKLHEISLETGFLSLTDLRPDCRNDRYGFIGQFYTGSTLIADTAKFEGATDWPKMYSYPNWVRMPFILPSEHSPIGIMSQYQTHMIWADSPGFSPQDVRKAYVYDVRNNTMLAWETVDGDYYRNKLMSISGMGERVSHYNDIYDGQLNYIGSLGDAGSSSSNIVTISVDGTRAAFYSANDRAIALYDISVDTPPFLQIGQSINFNQQNVTITKLLLSEDNKSLFVFSYNHQDGISKMKVINI